MVKFFCVALLALFSTTGLLADENQTDSVRVVSAEGHFVVTFPAGFSHAAKEEESVETELGTISTVNYVSFNDTSVAMAGAGSYPDSIAANMKTSSEQLFLVAEESLMASLSGTITNSSSFKNEDYPGTEIEFITQMEDILLQGYARFIFDGKRLYSMIYITSDSSVATANEIKDFFNSFVIHQNI